MKLFRFTGLNSMLLFSGVVGVLFLVTTSMFEWIDDLFPVEECGLQVC